MDTKNKLKSQNANGKNCILYLVLSIKYENDKWKLEIRNSPRLGGAEIKKLKIGGKFCFIIAG
jgi:hypothetical protein